MGNTASSGSADGTHDIASVDCVDQTSSKGQASQSGLPVVTDQRSYGCSSFHDGRACSNGVRVRRDRAEVVLLDPIRKGLLSPERVERMAKEMRASYVDHLRALQTREAERPQELRA